MSIDNGTTWKDIAGANTTTYIRNPTANGKYLYRLSVAESGNGSIASCRVVSNTVIINVVPNPTLQFSSATVCEGSNLTLNGVINYKSPLIGSFVITYPESNPSFVSKSQTDDPVTNSSTIVQVIHSTFKSAGKYILTAQNSSGCSASDSISILVNEKPVSRFSYDALTCEKSNINFKDQSTAKTAITNWNWKFGDGKTASVQNPTHSYDSAATYMVSLTTTDANGCVSDTVTKNIIVHALPQTDFILPKVCLADPFAQFINSTTISDKSESLFSYLWNFGDPSSGSNSVNIKDPQHVYKSTGSYNVSLRVTSSNNCIKDTFKIFTVNGSVPKAMFTVDNGNTICSADSVSLTNTSTVNFGSIVKVRIFWDNTNNPNISTTDDSPYVGKKYLFNYASLMSQQVQNFTIRYVVNSGINCVNETLQTITNNKTPTIKFDSLSNLCEEITPFSITGGSETSGAKGIGTYSGAGITGSDNFNPRAAGVGVHQIRYTFVTDAGCSAFKEQPITIYPQPSVSAGKSKTIIKGATITLHPTASGKGLSYLWSPSTFLDNVNDSTPKSMPLNDITYKLTVTSSDNCTNSDTINIKVINGLYVPNAFTPNNDGRNDVWRLPYLDEYPNTEVSIFNRFGDMIFHSIGSAVSWDGTYKGVQQPSGIYIYLIDLKTLPLIKGTIMLIR